LFECLASHAISHDACVVCNVESGVDIAGRLCPWESSGVAVRRSATAAGGVSENSAGVTARAFSDDLDVMAWNKMLART
jgi:hypothetical protein